MGLQVGSTKSYRIGEREKAALRVSRMFRGLSGNEFEAALMRGRARGARYEKGATIAEAGSRRADFMVLLSGRIQGVREQEGGALDFVQLFVPGEICGLDIACSASRKCPFRLQALDECDIVFVDYDGMFSGKISPLEQQKLRDGVTQTLANESLRRLHKIDVLYRRALRDRVMVYLENVCFLAGSDSIELNMDREQFAQYLGVNRSALSHELSQMRKDGLIDFHKGSFKLL
ncbi:MAG: Crp/Fnr family transcriptional regulator [Clostridiales bacterium]|nr:Crp/Fnr family transcriptional regulator [Clostridiales bacterium]